MIWVGTSGYNYPEWKGSFYPATLSSAKMLPYYAERFPTVEINYTFYRMPTEKLIAGWAAQAPEGVPPEAGSFFDGGFSHGGDLWCELKFEGGWTSLEEIASSLRSSQ